MSVLIKPISLLATGFILFFSSHSFASNCGQDGGGEFSELNCTIPPNGSGLSAICNKAYSDGATCGQLTCDVFIGIDYGDDLPWAYLYKNEGVVLPEASNLKLGVSFTLKNKNGILESKVNQLTAKPDSSKVDNNQITWSKSGIASVCNEVFPPSPPPPTNIQVDTGLQMYGQPPIAGGWAVAQFTWQESPTAKSYNVEYCTGNPCPSLQWLTQSCSGSPCLIKNLSPSISNTVTYSFRVSASNSSGVGLPSSTITASTPVKANVYGLINGLATGNSVTIQALPNGIPKTFTTSPIAYDVPYGTTSLSVSGNGQSCTMADLQIPEFAYHRQVPASGFVVFERNITCN